jgi:hypothetical protein
MHHTAALLQQKAVNRFFGNANAVGKYFTIKEWGFLITGNC